MVKAITGDKQLDRALARLEEKVQRRLGSAALRSGLNAMARGIRKEVPPSKKDIRKAIGSRFSKSKGGANKGVKEAKVGAGVGKQKPPQSRGSRPGVGIGGRNIHWWILGTGSRRHKSGKSTGSMPPQGLDIVRNGFNASQGAAMEKIKKSLEKGIKREAAKR